MHATPSFVVVVIAFVVVDKGIRARIVGIIVKSPPRPTGEKFFVPKKRQATPDDDGLSTLASFALPSELRRTHARAILYSISAGHG